jgi:hypothetical protein
LPVGRRGRIHRNRGKFCGSDPSSRTATRSRRWLGLRDVRRSCEQFSAASEDQSRAAARSARRRGGGRGGPLDRREQREGAGRRARACDAALHRSRVARATAPRPPSRVISRSRMCPCTACLSCRGSLSLRSYYAPPGSPAVVHSRKERRPPRSMGRIDGRQFRRWLLASRQVPRRPMCPQALPVHLLWGRSWAGFFCLMASPLLGR